MKTEYKIYAALIVLLGLVGAFFLLRSSDKAEKEARAPQSAKSELPQVALLPENLEKVTKLEFKPAGKEPVVLEKSAEGWQITAPKAAKANAADVKSLLEGMKNLKVTDAIDRGTTAYEKYEVSDGKGVHFVMWSGNEKSLEVVFGQSGSRGQTLRVLGKDGVWVAEGYQGSYFTKDMKGWRDKTVLKLEDANVASVEIENDHGKYLFTKDGDNWSGKFDKNPNKKDEAKPEEKKDEAKKDGDAKKDDAKKDEKADAKKDGDAKKDDAKKDEKADAKKDEKADAKKDEKPKNPGWEKFDGKNVENMLRAFKTLNAVDFGGAEDDTGFDAAVKEGGVITLTMKDGKKHKLVVGKKQKGSNRFVKKDGDETVFVISSWAADWATAEPKKFEKKDEKKDDKKGDAHAMPPMEEPDFELPMDE